MKFKKNIFAIKVVSVLLSIIMIISNFPIYVNATETNVNEEYVYISICEEDEFLTDKNGNAMAYMPIAIDKLKTIDLNEYGLSDYLYDKENDGIYEITMLHLFIYVHETVLGMDWNDVDPYGGSPASMYFSSGLFGFEDENLRYNYNGKYPADENGWGFTADRIVLSDGDFLEVVHFSDFYFYMDSAYGFRYFADENDNTQISFNAEAGTPLSIKLNRVGGGMGWEEFIIGEPETTVYYGKSVGNETGSVTTDINGCVEITFPSAGTWYIWSESGVGIDAAFDSKVTSPANAKINVVSKSQEPSNEPSNGTQDVSNILNATLAQLAITVDKPSFGTNAGEWTVLCLARSGYYDANNIYFKDYYDRIVETVNTKAASVNMNGALHKKKSTDNSRLIVALSAIGKDATNVGEWNLIAPYEDFEWIKNQGINGSIWALIALDSNNYQTKDNTIRQQCIDQILSLELESGGWPLTSGNFDNDITCMALQALYPYRNQSEVAAAVERAFNYLSEIQLETGGFLYGGSETSESAAQVIVACTTWGINPDTDTRFVKNGKSVVDNLIGYYIENESMFAHQGNISNAMATDQACYALVAYDRFINGKTSLYDYSDVIFETVTSPVTSDFTASLGLPEKVENINGTLFNGTVSVNGWNNEAGYKLIDMVIDVPEGISVKDVTVGNRLVGGTINYNLADGKLRVVYFDANSNSDLIVNGSLSSNITLFNITFCIESANAGDILMIKLAEMSLKTTSNSTLDESKVDIIVENAKGNVTVVEGRSFSAGVLYQGDGVDLIPSNKKAILVTVTALNGTKKLTYNDGSNVIEFKYNSEISAKLSITSYVALVDEAIELTEFEKAENYIIDEANAESITFGDINGDGVINAQDALGAVDMWLRKGDEPTNDKIISVNVNGDGRIDTYDALGIVESFVYDDKEYVVINKATSVFVNK